MIMMANRTAMGTKCKRLDSRKGVSITAKSIWAYHGIPATYMLDGVLGFKGLG